MEPRWPGPRSPVAAELSGANRHKGSAGNVGIGDSSQVSALRAEGGIRKREMCGLCILDFPVSRDHF